MFKPSHQIRFLISPIENLLICLKYLLVPFGFLTIAFRVYKAPEILEQKIGLTMGAWQLGLLLIATLLLYLPKTFTTMNHSFLWFRRHLILLCESGFPVVLSRSSKTFCAISRYRYPYPSLTHKGQKEIERIIINYLKKGVSRTTCGPIFYISGKSGAGKSTLAFRSEERRVGKEC